MRTLSKSVEKKDRKQDEADSVLIASNENTPPPKLKTKAKAL